MIPDGNSALTHLSGKLRKPPRVGAAVAAVLRQSIVSGDFTDSQLLPKEDELLATFQVSRQSIREAMRILETEGLVTVRRGNVGGAVVHAPRPDTAAYMLGLVLESQGTTFGDLATALMALEATCAALCAERPDRARSVVPLLERHTTGLRELAAEQQISGRVARQFHQRLVAGSGSDTLALVTSTLEMLWSAEAGRWTASVTPTNPDSASAHLAVITAHTQITDFIAEGNADSARRALIQHLSESPECLLTSEPDRVISSTALRPDMRI